MWMGGVGIVGISEDGRDVMLSVGVIFMEMYFLCFFVLCDMCGVFRVL